MRILALDLGTRRIGLALSDPEATLAFPAGFLERRGIDPDLAALRELVEDRQVGEIVVGLPIHMDGRVGPEAEAARGFAKRLAATTGVRVELLDERWTTRAAERALREAGRRTAERRGKGTVDAVAAALLLQTYLERRARCDEDPGSVPS